MYRSCKISEHEPDSSFHAATKRTGKLCGSIIRGFFLVKYDHLPLWKLQKQLKRATLEPGLQLSPEQLTFGFESAFTFDEVFQTNDTFNRIVSFRNQSTHTTDIRHQEGHFRQEAYKQGSVRQKGHVLRSDTA